MFYALEINDYSPKSLMSIFDHHVNKGAQVTTDYWKGYRPFGKDYLIKQVLNELGLNFKAIQTIIHKVESFLITTYYWIRKRHIDRCLSELSFRIN
jgi:hypothetical protein